MTASEKLSQESDYSRGESDSLRIWRREKVWELKSCGLTIDEIVETLKTKPNVKISHGTVAKDLRAKEEEIERNFEHYIKKELPMQHHLAVTGLDRVIKESWRIYARASDDRTRLAAMSIISDATMKKQAILGDPAQIEKAIRLVGKVRADLANRDEDAQEQAHSTAGLKEGSVG